MAKEPVLVIENLQAFYGDFQALWDVSLEVNEGEIVSIIGANGAGKSTLMRAICGIVHIGGGEIRYKGIRLNDLPAEEIVALGLSMVPEGRKLFPRLSVMENLKVGSYLPKVRSKSDQLVKTVFELFPILEERKNQLSSTLSGGEQQMLAIGRSLMSEPQLILLDELSLGLAPIVIKEVYKKIEEINQKGLTILLVEQNVKKSLEISHRTFVLCQGRVNLDGASCDLSETCVKDAYFGMV